MKSVSTSAGIAFTAGGDVLVLRRSPKVASPRTWAVPGGHVEPGESTLEAAVREIDEEILNAPARYVVSEELVFGGDLDFTMFIAPLRRRFTPRLNWENDDYRWADREQLSRLKLHPGFKKILQRIGEID